MKSYVLAALGMSLASANVFNGQCEFMNSVDLFESDPDLESIQGMWYEIYSEENFLTDKTLPRPQCVRGTTFLDLYDRESFHTQFQFLTPSDRIMNVIRSTAVWNPMSMRVEKYSLEMPHVTSPAVTYDDFYYFIVDSDPSKYVSLAACRNLNANQMQLELVMAGRDPTNQLPAEIMVAQQKMAQTFPGYIPQDGMYTV